MFIKTINKKNKNSDKVFIYHRLVESYRTANGSRHRTILNLGTLTIDSQHFKTLADRIEQIISGIKPLFPVSSEVESLAEHFAALLIEQKIKFTEYYLPDEVVSDFDEIDLNTLQTSKCRSIGVEYISYDMMNRLGFFDIFKSLDFSDSDIRYAIISIIGRMVNPTSERGTYRWVKNESGLEELLNDDFTRLSRNKMYEVIDKLVENKELIEQRLREQEKNIFSLKEKIILYDLTNTYFEGMSQSNVKAKRGRSKEKRSDCPIVTVGLVIDELGFPKRSRILDGNVSEPKTLLSMIKDLIADCDMIEKPTILIDAGISSEENLAMLRQAGYDYVCVARNNPLKSIDISKVDFQTVKQDNRNEVRVKMFRNGSEQILYCESYLKRKKESAMKSMYEQRFEDGLKNIEASLHKKRGMKSYGKVCERIGRLKEKAAPIARFYEIDIEKDEQEIVTKIEWHSKNDAETAEIFNGSYMLRSSRTDLTEQELWELYTTLTNVENTFRVLKTDLNMRPIHHQKTERSDGHIFITILAYHIVNSILTMLKQAGINNNWSTIRSILRTMLRCTTTMNNKAGDKIVLRTTSMAEKEQQRILSALKLKFEPIGRKKIIMKL